MRKLRIAVAAAVVAVVVGGVAPAASADECAGDFPERDVCHVARIWNRDIPRAIDNVVDAFQDVVDAVACAINDDTC